MSNHSGSYMLNEVFQIMEEENILQNLSQDDRCAFIKKVTHMATADYDCNAGEILDEIGQRLRICYSCFEEGDIDDGGLCEMCEPDATAQFDIN